MGFKYNSVVRFNANTDVGLDRVALGSLITITDGGVEKFFQYKDDTGVTNATTIATAISGGNIVGADLVLDTTPVLGGDLECAENTINDSSFRQITDASLGTGTHVFNYSNGDMQQLTATGNITLGISNFPAGNVAGFIVDAVNFGAHTITHPAAWTFAGGVAPAYTTAGTDRILITNDKDGVKTLTVIAYDIKAV